MLSMTASLVPHAGVDSNPRTTSGPADSSCIFTPQGQLIEARRDGWRLGNSADRARLYGGGESADHPGLVSLPGSQSVLDTPTQSCLVDWEPCRRALSPDSGRGGTFHSLTSRNQLGGNSARHCAQGHPGLGSLHVPNMEQANVEVVAPAYVNERG